MTTVTMIIPTGHYFRHFWEVTIDVLKINTLRRYKMFFLKAVRWWMSGNTGVQPEFTWFYPLSSHTGTLTPCSPAAFGAPALPWALFFQRLKCGHNPCQVPGNSQQGDSLEVAKNNLLCSAAQRQDLNAIKLVQYSFSLHPFLAISLKNSVTGRWDLWVSKGTHPCEELTLDTKFCSCKGTGLKFKNSLQGRKAEPSWSYSVGTKE